MNNKMKPEDHNVELNRMIKEQFKKDKCSGCPDYTYGNDLTKKVCTKFPELVPKCYSKYLEEKNELLKLNQCDGLSCDVLSELLNKKCKRCEDISILKTRITELSNQLKQAEKDQKHCLENCNFPDKCLGLEKENEQLKENYNINQIIDMIMNAEILIPIEKFFNKDKTPITKKKYGIILLKTLCKELKEASKK